MEPNQDAKVRSGVENARLGPDGPKREEHVLVISRKNFEKPKGNYNCDDAD